MFRRQKDLVQLARLEIAAQKLEAAKSLLMESGEPMLSNQASALLDKARLEIDKARQMMGMTSLVTPATDRRLAG